MPSIFPTRLRKTRACVLINGKFFIIDYKKEEILDISPILSNLDAQALGVLPLTDINECFCQRRKTLRYKEYWHEDKALRADAKENKAKHKRASQPALIRILENESKPSSQNLRLPLPFIKTDDSLSKLSSILFVALGKQNLGSFYKDKIFIKNVPSVGARHGIEAYVTFEGKLFYYNCMEHSLDFISYKEDRRYI